jgi:hypothetical protein
MIGGELELAEEGHSILLRAPSPAFRPLRRGMRVELSRDGVGEFRVEGATVRIALQPTSDGSADLHLQMAGVLLTLRKRPKARGKRWWGRVVAIVPMVVNLGALAVIAVRHFF